MGRTPGPIYTKFCTMGDIWDIITDANFGYDRLRNFCMVMGHILGFSVGFRHRPYNTPCECMICFPILRFIVRHFYKERFSRTVKELFMRQNGSCRCSSNKTTLVRTSLTVASCVRVRAWARVSVDEVRARTAVEARIRLTFVHICTNIIRSSCFIRCEDLMLWAICNTVTYVRK